MKHRWFAFSAILLLAGTGHAKGSYLVSAEIYRDGGLLGAPAFTVSAATQGSVSSGETYSLGVVVSNAKHGAVLVSSDLKVDSDHIQPKMMLDLGEEGAVQIGSLKLKMFIHQISGRDDGDA